MRYTRDPKYRRTSHYDRSLSSRTGDELHHLNTPVLLHWRALFRQSLGTNGTPPANFSAVCRRLDDRGFAAREMTLLAVRQERCP